MLMMLLIPKQSNCRCECTQEIVHPPTTHRDASRSAAVVDWQPPEKKQQQELHANERMEMIPETTKSVLVALALEQKL